MKLKPVYKKTTRVNVRLTDELMYSLERLSAEYGLSISELIRQVLEQAIVSVKPKEK